MRDVIEERLVSFADRLRSTLDAVNVELAAKGAAEVGDYASIPASVRSIEQGVTLPTQEKTASPSVKEQEIVPDDGYTLSKVTVGAAPLEAGSASPATSEKEYTPASGKYGFSRFTVGAMPSGALSDPSISVDSNGLITAAGGVSTPGYIASGSTKSNTKQLPAQSGGTYTLNPGQSVSRSAGTYLTSALSVTAAEVFEGLKTYTDVLVASSGINFTFEKSIEKLPSTIMIIKANNPNRDYLYDVLACMLSAYDASAYAGVVHALDGFSIIAEEVAVTRNYMADNGRYGLHVVIDNYIFSPARYHCLAIWE